MQNQLYLIFALKAFFFVKSLMNEPHETSTYIYGQVQSLFFISHSVITCESIKMHVLC